MAPKRILVVDDDEHMLQSIERALSKAGYEVVVAANGKAALANLTPELAAVISDVHMPEMDGIELLLELRREIPELPIISITGGGIEGKHQVLKITRALGAVKTLPKPFSRAELLDAVEEVIGREDGGAG